MRTSSGVISSSRPMRTSRCTFPPGLVNPIPGSPRLSGVGACTFAQDQLQKKGERVEGEGERTDETSWRSICSRTGACRPYMLRSSVICSVSLVASHCIPTSIRFISSSEGGYAAKGGGNARS